MPVRKTKIGAVQIGTHSVQTNIRETSHDKGIVPFRHDRVQGNFDRRQQRRKRWRRLSTRATSATARVSTSTRTNKADGADVHVKTGDQVHQKAYWDAGGANAKAERFSKADGGMAKSNGDQEFDSGHDKSNVDANTTAYQDNWLAADMGQNVMAGIGGDGGDHNKAEGGDVHFKASIESANLNDVLNHSEQFHIDDFVHV